MGTMLKTPLYDWHVVHGGRLVDFAGWSMPVQYGSIVTEHVATRTAATLFDVSHMGRFRFPGEAAGGWLDAILTRRVDDLKPGRVRYSLVTNELGGVLDDVLVSRVEGISGQTEFWMVVNASNREKIASWLMDHGAPLPAADFDRTVDTAMIALQGPLAMARACDVLGTDAPRQLRYYQARWITWDGRDVLVSRTGYTGEDGVELVVPRDFATAAWERLWSDDAAAPVAAAGLGARDTLRLEAAMPLYGHELSEQIDPFQAGLGFAVDLDGREFPGADALRQLAQQPTRERVGLQLEGRRPAREGCTVRDLSEADVGVVTSGTFAPTLDAPIAMAFVTPDLATVGTRLAVDIRGKQAAAEVVSLPFYRRPR